MITDISRVSYTDYQEYKAALDAELQQSAESFVRIGYMLKLARDTDILTGSGYNSVNEFAREEYNIDKTMVSRFISINDRFSEGGNSDRLQEQYRGFGYAKLSIMLQLPDAVNEEITPAFSKAEVQALKDEVDEERKVTDIEVLIEPKNEAQEAMGSNLDKAVHQLGHDNPKLYAELHAAINRTVNGTENPSAIQETLAPSGEGIFSIRIMGVGRLLLSVKDLERDVTLTNVRTGEKENYTWVQMAAAVRNIVVVGGTAEECYEMIYDEKFPVKEEEKKEIAPVQPKTEPPKPKKQSKVTKAPKPVPKKQEYVAPAIVPVEQEPERIAPEDVEIVENTKCETDFEENETVMVENETDLEEIDTENKPEAAEILNAEPDFTKCGACMFFGKPVDAPETVEQGCMWVPSGENGYEKPCVALENASNATEDEDFGRLTKSDNLGNWGVRGLLWKELKVGQIITQKISEKLYGCLCKLKDYEKTGLSPEEVERLGEEMVLLDNRGEYHFCTCGKPAEDNMGNGYDYCPNCGRKFFWKETEDK